MSCTLLYTTAGTYPPVGAAAGIGGNDVGWLINAGLSESRLVRSIEKGVFGGGSRVVKDLGWLPLLGELRLYAVSYVFCGLTCEVVAGLALMERLARLVLIGEMVGSPVRVLVIEKDPLDWDL